MLAALLLLSFSFISYGASVSPSFVEGNDPQIDGYEKFKIDSPKTGSYNQGDLTVDITLNTDGNSVEWNSNVEISMVFVKGGPNGYLYTYTDGAYSDTNLYSPINDGGQVPQISHISFYYKVDTTTGTDEQNDETPSPSNEQQDETVTPDNGDKQDTTTEVVDTKEDTEGKNDEKKADTKEDLPKTGENDPALISLVGAAIVLLGGVTFIIIRKKEMKN